MSAWWLVPAFLLGWGLCWKTSGWLIRKALRKETYFQRALASLPQERLVRVQEAVNAEREKRKA